MTFDLLCKLLKERNDFLILTHKRPDGDTLGSAAALCRILRTLGKRACVLPNSGATARYDFLLGGLLAPEDFAPACIVAVDIADEALLPPEAEAFRGRTDICIDHHPSNTRYAAALYLEGEAAAVGEVIFKLYKTFGIAPYVKILEAIYVSVATDTGCFRFSNTTALAHSIAAECISAGVDFHRLNVEFFDSKSPARFKIERAVFDSLRFFCGGRAAVACLTQKDIAAAGAGVDDLDNLASLLMQISTIHIASLLQENADGSWKVSVRSRAPVSASDICLSFGGGGHPRAAGCTMHGDADGCTAQLGNAFERALANV